MDKRAREALAQVPLFAPLSSRHLKRLADVTEEHRYMEGAPVVREGEIGDTFYVILQGEAKVVNKAGHVLARLVPGEFFGEISLLDGGPRTATVIGMTPLLMLGLPRKAFQDLLSAEPAVAIKVLQHVAAMLRRLDRPSAG